MQKKTKSKTKIISSLFEEKNIPHDAQEILENFDKIVQGVFPISNKQKIFVPRQIRALSHELTDERSARHLSYMNDKISLSAYVRYYMWWNLVRLVRLFSNVDFSLLNLNDGSVCLDIGSGPLTVVSALWLSHPELRTKHLTWYCMDISQSALSIGEEIYLSIAAHTGITKNFCNTKTTSNEEPTRPTSAGGSKTETAGKTESTYSTTLKAHWKIVKVQGALGKTIREKANLITCANVFNEIFEKDNSALEGIAKKNCERLLSYACGGRTETTLETKTTTRAENGMTKIAKKNETISNTTRVGVFIIEPGIPRSARFISLVRDAFLLQGFSILSPCTHCKKCAMDGRRISFKNQKSNETPLQRAYGKWCNFAFSTENAPKKLLELSSAANIPKERAVLSFMFVARGIEQNQYKNEETIFARIASDIIKLPQNKIGYYACSSEGLLLCINKSGTKIKSGMLLEIPQKNITKTRDKKSGALIVEI